MPQDDRNILDLLKSELNFLKNGGYGRSPREAWRAQLFFEDSPSCMNYDNKQNPNPCAECAFIQFVPPDKRDEKVPCRHIPLTRFGETLFDLYNGGTQQELEDALADWLRGTIKRLEADQAPKTATTPVAVQKTLTPVRGLEEILFLQEPEGIMFLNLHPKCANPACAAAFDWLKGGKLFRFHRELPLLPSLEGNQAQRDNSHHVEHFWLCEECSHIYTLGYEPGRGILIRQLWPELPAAEDRMPLSVA